MSDSNTTFTKEEFDAAIKDAVSDALAEFKTKMDALDKERRNAVARTERLDKELKAEEARREQLEAEHNTALSKSKEVFEAKLSEQTKAFEELRNLNVALTRDTQLKGALAGLPFKNAKASDMAYRDIVNQLVEKDGEWRHTSGCTMQEFVNKFAADADQSFLFVQSATSGSGAGSSRRSSSETGYKSLSDLPQSELLRLAEEGKLPNQKT